MVQRQPEIKKIKQDPISKIPSIKKGWWSDSSGRAPA
jgi:hypothetical protein